MVALRIRFFFFFLLISLLLLLCHIGYTAGLTFDSIYQFGDSLSDTGNAIRLSGLSGCSSSPNGITYFGKPTGRCSDGLLMVDFIARAFNLPLLDPYLKKDGNFSHGVNFAVAGATALNASSLSSKVTSGFPVAPNDNSLSVQLGWFETYLNSACFSSSDCKQKFQKTLFLMGEIGGDDYNFPLMLGKSVQDLQSLVPDVVQTIADAMKNVIDHGAVQVVVPGNFPIGCMPIYLNSFRSTNSIMYDDLGCLKSLNEFAKFHNDQLQQAITDLKKQHSGVAIYYGDYYSAFTWVLQNAASLGFEKDGVFKPCLNGASVCSDPKKRISWDGTHLTQEMYRNLARWLLSNTFSETIPCCPEPSKESTSQSSGANVITVVLLRVVLLSSLGFWAIGSKLI